MKTITVLGSTGSVGRQVLDVISRYPNRYKVVGLSAYTNGELLSRQISEFGAEYYYFPSGERLIGTYKAPTKWISSLEELASVPADIVVLAVSGIAGLLPAIAVLKRGGTLAIANKETIVCAGRHLKVLEKQY
ncbi:MAG: hypothetical protein K2M36_02540 [Clostridia bacterium]|nr:hypothetical protein [Clostridia bacterium]